MSRYKDVDKILEAMDTWPKYGCKPDGRFLELTKETEADYVPYVHYDDMVQAVTGTPVQDVAPVVHAEWTRKRTQTHDGELYCSNCEWTPEVLGVTTLGDLQLADVYFCPSCGARMDGEKE